MSTKFLDDSSFWNGYTSQAALNAIVLVILAWMVYTGYNDKEENYVKNHIEWFVLGILLLVVQNVVAYLNKNSFGPKLLIPTTAIYVIIGAIMLVARPSFVI